jgi:hypothetical protein
MAWIENKWATVYINQAVNIIKTTVGLANFIEKQLLIQCRQMGKYRDCNNASKVPAPPPPKHRIVDTKEPAFFNLWEAYGLSNDMSVSLSVAENMGQTSDVEEYSAYVSGPRSSKAIDILRFWEVRRTRRSSNMINC